MKMKTIKKDIETLENEFKAYQSEWTESDYAIWEQAKIARQELVLTKTIANHYPFEFDPVIDFSEEWFHEQEFTLSDFENNNVDEDNYMVAEATAFAMKEQLVDMLTALYDELKWLPKRFRDEFYNEVICSAPQTAKTVKKNVQYFAETIEEELTEEEKEKMYMVI